MALLLVQTQVRLVPHAVPLSPLETPTPQVGAAAQEGHAALAIEQAALLPPFAPLQVQVWVPPQAPALKPLAVPAAQVLGLAPQVALMTQLVPLNAMAPEVQVAVAAPA